MMATQKAEESWTINCQGKTKSKVICCISLQLQSCSKDERIGFNTRNVVHLLREIVPVSELSWFFPRSVQFNNTSDLLIERGGGRSHYYLRIVHSTGKLKEVIDALRQLIGKDLWGTWVSAMGVFLLQAQKSCPSSSLA